MTRQPELQKRTKKFKFQRFRKIFLEDDFRYVIGQFFLGYGAALPASVENWDNKLSFFPIVNINQLFNCGQPQKDEKNFSEFWLWILCLF